LGSNILHRSEIQRCEYFLLPPNQPCGGPTHTAAPLARAAAPPIRRRNLRAPRRATHDGPTGFPNGAIEFSLFPCSPSRSASTRRPRLSSPRCVAKLGDGALGCGTLCFLSPSAFLSQPWWPLAHDAAPQLLVVRQWVIEVCTYTRAYLESRPAQTSPGLPSITAVVATIIRDLGGGFVKIPWIPHGLSHGRVHRREEAPDDAGPFVSSATRVIAHVVGGWHLWAPRDSD
jgi:hypothetical protein